MRLNDLPAGLRLRLIVAGFLSLGVVVLFAANRVADKSAARRSATAVNEARGLEGIAAAVDTVLRRYGIPPGSVKTWRVSTVDKRFSRVERRINVPPEFISLNFNLDLNRELDRYDARVIATERTKESAVTIHIVLDGKTIESITFITKRDLQQE